MPPKKSIEQKYQKKEQREHILLRPDSYIGSTKKVSDEYFVFDDNKMVKKVLTFVPGLFKIFDEILVNAIDHSVSHPEVKKIKVTIDKKTGEITVWNNGPGIPIVKHSEHQVYVPELIFGHLLSGSNFDDTDVRFTGGRNGFGAKLCNIYSKQFSLETVDAERKQKYSQTWNDNMTQVSTPKVTGYTRVPYTQISFIPDYPRFGMTKLTSDTIALFERRVYDAAACTNKSVQVELNGETIKIKEFEKYVDLYIGSKKDTTRVYEAKENHGMLWEVAACMNPNIDEKFQHVSFVNGIATPKGGKHVDYIANQIVRKLTEVIKKKAKGKELNVRFQTVKDRIFLFLKTTIVNPTFSSQTKEELTTNTKDFGFSFELSDTFIEKLGKCGIIQDIIDETKYRESKELAKKTDGKKTNKIYGIPKLEDANFAGTSKSNQCTLILTEGDSAKAFAIEGLSVIGRDYYGVFPLKGKPLNVREATQKQLVTNEEIINIKQILGLQQDKKYTSPEQLRYGSILCLADSDVDGFHIKGLLMNLFHTWWGNLLDFKGFIKSLATPIIKASKGKQTETFFTLTDYNRWKEQSSGNWRIKYYKGLGTSNRQEARDCFQGLVQKQIEYTKTKECDNRILLAFEKKQTDNRKDWISQYNENVILEQSNKSPSYAEFVDKELIHFSVADVKRSIPSICDGLKPSQRKVLFGCFKRNLTSEVKVAQLSGYISEHSAYHHGEMSLNQTIIGLAQNYTGSNNINLLTPSGQFGTRYLGGKDSASPRYIFTSLEPITNILFDNRDFPLLKYLDDDGKPIEPEWYIPILPMVLINGAEGIGTGFSTSIPCYNPIDIIEGLIALIKNEPIEPLKPWYRGFTGEIVPNNIQGNWISKGVWKRLSNTKLEITELPIGTWITNYKEFLETLIKPNTKAKQAETKRKTFPLESFTEKHKNQNVHFVLEFLCKETLDEYINSNSIEKELRLTKHHATTNMHLFDSSNKIKKYSSPEEILTEFYQTRQSLYIKRKRHLIDTLNQEIIILSAKVKFIEEIMSETIIVFKKPKKDIEAQLKDKCYPQVEGNWNYLTSLPIYTFSLEKITELKQKLDNTQQQVESIQSKTPSELWEDDLSQFVDTFEIHQSAWKKDVL